MRFCCACRCSSADDRHVRHVRRDANLTIVRSSGLDKLGYFVLHCKGIVNQVRCVMNVEPWYADVVREAMPILGFVMVMWVLSKF